MKCFCRLLAMVLFAIMFSLPLSAALAANGETTEEFYQWYSDGYNLFEEGKYEEAIESYQKAMEYDGPYFYSMMEIAEAYILLQDFQLARDWLTEAKPYISAENELARWYRRYGYIAIEEGEYELAYALYQYSLGIEPSTMAEDEINYILRVAPDTKQLTAEEAANYLSEHFTVPAE